MSLPEFRPGVHRDMEEAIRWYEDQRPGLGGEFLDLLFALLDRIEGYPLQFPIYSGSVRRGLLQRFRFGVFFTIENERAVVLAIQDLRRGTELWRDRL